MKTAFLIALASLLLLTGCMTAQQRADYLAGQEAARQGRIVAQQALEAVRGIKPHTLP